MNFKNGQPVQTLDNKTVKSLELCRWHCEADLNDPERSEIPSTYTGYCEHGCVYDNCRFEYLKTLSNWDQQYMRKWKNFVKFKEVMNTSIKKLKLLLANLKLRDVIKNDIEKITKILNDGFRMVKIHGNKRKKPIDEIEVENLNKKLKNQKSAYDKIKSELKGYEKLLFDIVKNTRHYDTYKIQKLNFAWNDYANTVYLYDEFNELYNNVSSRVENYDELYAEFMDDIDALEITQVKEKRDVRHKARYYIDEQGNKIELDISKSQTIIHK